MNRALIAALLTLGTALHGGGKLKLASKHLMVNAAFELTGTEFAKKEPFTILLVGAAGRIKLGEVKADTAGKFKLMVTIPAGTRPGSYRLMLEASDDDEASTTDVMVMADEGMVAVAGERDAGQHDDMDMPSHEPLQLDRARSPLVTGGAITSIVLMLAVGGFLLRRNGRG